MLDFFIHDSKLNIWVLDCWMDKTRHLMTLPYALGNYNILSICCTKQLFEKIIGRLIDNENNCPLESP